MSHSMYSSFLSRFVFLLLVPDEGASWNICLDTRLKLAPSISCYHIQYERALADNSHEWKYKEDKTYWFWFCWRINECHSLPLWSQLLSILETIWKHCTKNIKKWHLCINHLIWNILWASISRHSIALTLELEPDILFPISFLQSKSKFIFINIFYHH